MGIQHALDPDHLIAVSTIVSEHKSFKWASLIGAFWGLGHTTTLFIVGLLVVGLRLTIPPLTEERRKEMVKLVKKYGEEGKVAIRNIRRDATDDVEKLKKTENLSEDEVKRRQEQIQKLTDRYTQQLEKVIQEKEKEVLEV